jgi:hypothetical protein
MITFKEKIRRIKWRTSRLLNKYEYRRLPNFWYDPFEVFLLEHFKRAYRILTYDEFLYVDQALKVIEKNPDLKNRDPLKNWDHHVGDIYMKTSPETGEIYFIQRGEVKKI